VGPSAATPQNSRLPAPVPLRPLGRWNFGMGNRWFYSNETYVVYQSSTSAVTVPAGPGTRVPAADVTPLQ